MAYDSAQRMVTLTGLAANEAGRRGRAFRVTVKDVPPLTTLRPEVQVLARTEGQTFTIKAAPLRVPAATTRATVDAQGGPLSIAGGAARLDFAPGALWTATAITADLTALTPDLGRTKSQSPGLSLDEVDPGAGERFWSITLGPDLAFDAPVTLTTNISALVDLEALARHETVLVMRYVYTAFVTQTLETGQTIVRIEDQSEEMPFVFDGATGNVTATLKHFSTYDMSLAQSTAPKPWTPASNAPNVALFRGAATYRHPFPALPAFGLEPKLAAAYSSASAEGQFLQTHEPGMKYELGRGWSLEIPHISQLVVRKYILGDHPEVGWQRGFDTEARGNFTLVMNGISVGLRPTGANGVYVTEDSQALRIVRCAKASPCAAQYQVPGITLSGADWDSGALEYWQVWTPDGTRYVFGSDSSSRSIVEDWDYDWCGGPGCGNQTRTGKMVGQVWMLRWVYGPDRDALSAGVDRWGAEYQYAQFYDAASYCNTCWGGSQISCAQEPDERVRPTAIVYGNSLLGANNRYSVTFAYSGDKLTEVTAYAPGNLPATRARMTYGSVCFYSVCDELNGIADEVYTGTTWIGLPGPSFATAEIDTTLNGTHYGDNKRLLTQVNNGYGATWSFAYEPLTVWPGHGMVVKQRGSRSLAGAPETIDLYRYGISCLNSDWLDATGKPIYPCKDFTRAWHGSDYSLIGFGIVTHTAQDETGTAVAIDVHRFYTDVQRLGREYETRMLDGAGTALSAKQSDLVTVTLTGFPTTSWQVRVAETREYPLGDVGGAPMKKTRTDSYTALGSPKTVQEYGFDPAGDERTTFIGYAPGPIAGELPVWEALYTGILTAEVDTPARLSSTRLYYDYAENGRANNANSGFNPYGQTPSRGRLTAVENGLAALGGQPALWAMATYGYDAIGNLSVLTNAGLYTAAVVYDPAGQFVIQAFNPLGQASAYAYFGVNGVGRTNSNGITQPFGALKSVTDPNGATTLYDYDAFGRLTTVAGPPSGGGATDLDKWSTSYAYNTAYSNVAGVARVQIVETICENDPCSSHSLSSVSLYDGLGRVVQTRTPDGNAGQMRVSDTFYDALGRVSMQTVPYTRTAPQGVVDAPYAAVPQTAFGNGLTGNYFSPRDFDWWRLARIDATVDFNWGNGSPASGVSADNFAVRWTGFIRPSTSETYTFYATGDDGVRLWVGGQLLIDQWHDQGPTEYAVQMPLLAGVARDVKYEYYDNTGGASVSLKWSSATVAKEVIPQAALYTTAPGVTPSILYARTAYDALGRVTIVTAPDGTQTKHYYALDSSTAYGYTPTSLALHSVVDANKHSRHQVTDGLGRMMKVREFDGTGTGPDPWMVYAETSYVYDAANRLTSVTDAVGNVTTVAYDGLGRKVGMLDPDMGAWRYGYNGLGQLTSQTDAKGQTMSFGYDPLGRMTAKGARVTETTVYEAESAPYAHVSGCGGAVTYAGAGTAWVGACDSYFTVGPYAAPLRAGPGQSAVFRLAITSTQIASDPTIVAKIDVVDWTTGQTLALRELARSEFGGGIANYREFVLSFDTTGRETHQLEYRVWGYSGNETIAHDRTTLLWATPLATYAYDQGTNGIGRRARMTDTTGYSAWAYDARGRAITATKQINPNPIAYATVFGYDASNRLITMTYPGGEVVTNTFDAAGQPYGLYAGGSPIVKGASYNALGQPRSIDFGNGLSQRRYYGGLDTTLYSVSYGKMRQLCVAQTSLGECADDAAPGRGGTGTTLFNAVYGYDAGGNITAIDERTPNLGEINNYLYDSLDRLTEWRKVTSWSPYSATLQEAYIYNPIGNMTSKAGVTITSGTAKSGVLTTLGFEAYSVYSPSNPGGSFVTPQTFGSWSFEGSAGVSYNNTHLTSGNPAAPEGMQVAFIQGAARMTATVSGFTSGQTYRVGFQMAQRTNYGLPQTVTVRVGNVALGAFVAPTGAYGPKWSDPFTATATSQTIAFWGAPENGQDRMAFIDRVVLATAGPHAAVEMGNGNSYVYDPNGNMTVRREMSGTETFIYTQTWSIDNRLIGVTKALTNGAVLAETRYFFDGDGTRVRREDPDGTTLYIGPTEISLKYSTPEWTAATGTAADGFDLAKTALTNSWDAGAFDGSHPITGTGYVAIRVDTIYASRIVGLSPQDSGPSQCGIRYGLYLENGGGLRILENCAYVTPAALSTYTVGDQFSVEASGGVVRYKRLSGGSLTIYTSTLTPIFPLYVDTSFWTSGATLRDIRIIQNATSASSVLRTYYAFGGSRVAMRSAAGGPLTYLYGDHLGSASLTADANGTKIAEQRYKPHGEVRWSSAAAMQTEFGFTGQRAESSSYVGSLMDYVARSYSPALGRFVSADTIVPGAGNPQAYNRYMYVLGNPLRYADPTGHFCVPCFVVLFFVGVALTVSGDVSDQALVKAPARGDPDKWWIGPSVMAAGLVGVGLSGAIATQCALGKCQLAPQSASAAKLVPSAVSRVERVVEAASSDGDPTNEIRKGIEVLSSQGGAANTLSYAPRTVSALELGIRGRLDTFRATFALDGSKGTLFVDMIQGEVENPMEVLQNIIRFASSQGATVVRIEASIANPRLLDLLSRRYNVITEGGKEFLEFALEAK